MEHKTPDGYNAEIVILSYIEEKLCLYLCGTDKKYIPGQFIKEHETGKDAALRNLHTHFSTDEVFLRHVAIFDQPNRDYRGWIISNVFYVLINETLIEDKKNQFYEIEHLNPNEIAYDHLEIISKVYENVKKDLLETPIAKYLLKEEFAIRELQKLLLLVSDKSEITRTHFFTKIKKLPFITKALDMDGKQKQRLTKGAKRPSKLYKFKKKQESISIYF